MPDPSLEAKASGSSSSLALSEIMGSMMVIDAANVMGSRPDGWWRDRGKAAERLYRDLVDAMDAGRLEAPVILVLEGQARRGVAERQQEGLRVVHARGSGDDTIATIVAQATSHGDSATAVTADRELRDRVRRAGGDVTGPRWLLDQIRA